MPRRPSFLFLFLVAEWLQPASQLNIGKTWLTRKKAYVSQDIMPLMVRKKPPGFGTASMHPGFLIMKSYYCTLGFYLYTHLLNVHIYNVDPRKIDLLNLYLTLKLGRKIN